ncbi:MAG: hypothetical protein KJZ75_11420 [Hyphomonadaceae bacterium]|nr:hypothetical protein [Hyphomonadaceae bacterium]
MRLAQYLDENNIPDAEFARRIGVAHSLIHAWRYRKKTPSLSMARRVRIATRGAVTEMDWLDDETAHPPHQAEVTS